MLYPLLLLYICQGTRVVVGAFYLYAVIVRVFLQLVLLACGKPVVHDSILYVVGEMVLPRNLRIYGPENDTIGKETKGTQNPAEAHLIENFESLLVGGTWRCLHKTVIRASRQSLTQMFEEYLLNILEIGVLLP